MPKAKPISREDCERAMKVTKSNLAASRYLGCSYQHYKKFAKLYKVDTNDPDSPTLFDIHLNQSGKGIPKFLPHLRKEPAIKQIVETGEGWESFDSTKLKASIIREGLLPDECSRCGFHERRIIDYKVPLLFNFKDGDKRNWKLENLEFLCYNCYFVTIGSIFNNKEIKELEEVPLGTKSNTPEWELDEHYLENLENLGLLGITDIDIEPGSEFIVTN